MTYNGAKPYRITGKAIGFLIAAIVLYFLAGLTQVGWLYLVDSVLWGIFALSGLAFWLMPRGELNLTGPAQLSVLPYSGESLREEYQPPAF